MLRGVVQRGTGSRLNALGLPLAGKTGTSSDYVDAWFVGFSPDIAVGVFVGFDTPRSLGDGEGGSTVAAPLFGEVMRRIYADRPIREFEAPEGISWVRVDRTTGLPLPGGAEGGIVEAFRPGTEPTVAQSDGVFGGVGGPETDVGIGTGGLY